MERLTNIICKGSSNLLDFIEFDLTKQTFKKDRFSSITEEEKDRWKLAIGTLFYVIFDDAALTDEKCKQGFVNYLPFVYQGTTINKSGDNIESNLIMGNHPLSMAKAQEAVVNKYFVEVTVCIMKNDDINTLANGNKSILTIDTWLASSLSYDPEVVEVLLSSAVDAVGVNLPSLVLTTDAVGKLPVTSDIQNR